MRVYNDMTFKSFPFYILQERDFWTSQDVSCECVGCQDISYKCVWRLSIRKIEEILLFLLKKLTDKKEKLRT